MPIYEYRCGSCGFQKEYIQKFSDPLLAVCPECEALTFTKLLSAAGFQLKGSGWYQTDFKNPPARTKKPETTSEKTESKTQGVEKTGVQEPALPATPEKKDKEVSV